MAIDLNKLVDDAKKAQADAKARAEAAKKTAEKTKKDANTAAKYKQLNNYADTLRKSAIPFEATIKRYAARIARGDKLDSLEQNELDNAVAQYESLQATITKAQQDAYNLYTGRTESPAPVASPVGTPRPATGGAPTGTTAVAPAPAAPAAPAEPKTKPGTTKPGTTKAPATGTGTGKGKPTGTPTVTPTPTPTATPTPTLESILAKTEFWFDLPDYIFKTVPDLGKLLVKAVSEGWDNERFLSAARLTTWWQQNSAPIRERIIARAKFNELTASGQDASKTQYALDTASIKRGVQARARQMGANLDENAINQVVARIYDGFLEEDTLAIDSFIAPYIGRVSSIVGTGMGMQPSGYTGQALQNFQALQAVAKANGLKITDILPRLSVLPGQNLEDVVLQKLATGELDINRLAQDARNIAAQGTPDYVKGLLQQGYDLEQIFAPYKNVMGSILELNPDEIDLNDATLRGAIGQDKEMNVFDFKRALRKDSRWQYTENAREEVANSVLGILRDFGFQG
jgi:hypothetical protein